MEKLKFIKEKLEEAAYEEVHHNAENMDVCEMGEVIDMIKDISETMYYCTIVESMKENKEVPTKTM